MGKTVHDDKAGIEKQKELFTASLVHDLKNPLNAQIAALEQFIKGRFGGINALQKEILNEILKSSIYMKNMISSILGIYKFENGAVKLNKTLVNLDDIIKSCLRTITPLADGRCILFEYINRTHDSMLLCDENYITRILMNMLNNTIAYSYKNTKASVYLEEDDLFMHIIFQSCGIPIKEEFKTHIFEKYNSSMCANAGTGLGLYFCRHAAEAHGGSIELQAKNSDIKFIINLPKSDNGNSIAEFT